MIEPSSKVRLVVESRSEHVTLVRSMLAGFAEGTELSEASLNALRTSVSEASNNVVVHAYGQETGPLSVAIAKLSGGIDVLVEDEGSGISRVVPSADRMGLGLAVISSLADRAEFSSPRTGGTKVHLLFAGADGSTQLLDEPMPDPHLHEPTGLSGDVVAALAPASLLIHILGRLSRALAAQSHFSVKDITDLRQITDTIAQTVATSLPADPIWFSLTALPHQLKLSIGPFSAGHAGTALSTLNRSDAAAASDLIQTLAVRQSGDTEFLEVALLDSQCNRAAA